MPSKLFSASVVGFDAVPIEVEVDIDFRQLFRFIIVGLPDAAVTEAKDRVISAVRNTIGYCPRKHITANLAPAEMRKEGPGFDLPIALGVLRMMGELPAFDNESLFMGQLSLDGQLKHTRGALAVATMALDKGFKNLFLPYEDAPEAKLVKGIKVFGVETLQELMDHLLEKSFIEEFSVQKAKKVEFQHLEDLSCVKGQERAKRTLEIAAAGSHNLLFGGSPGSGKTMLARCLPSILPKMTLEESLEVTKIHSIAGILDSKMPLIQERPFRSPHHTASTSALVGGGSWPRPGEISLAHRGVLFLDEFAEFPREVLEALRQPLEDGIITISRANGSLTFPAKFSLIASMNPCPCGFLSDPDKECVCTPFQVAHYHKRISGPLLDRIDMHVDVPKVKFEKLSSDVSGESSEIVQQRVEYAQEIQRKRFKRLKIRTNSEMKTREIKAFCKMDQKSISLLKSAVLKMNLSARAYYRILKLSRTIADLSESIDIEFKHIAEGLQYRVRVES